MRRRPLLFALLVLGAGCADRTTDQGVSSAAAPIIGGSTHPGDPSIVFLRVRFRAGEGLCTATLIAPRVIVTAKHCICDTSTGAPVSAASVQVGVGADVDSGYAYEPVSEVRTTAGVCSEDVSTLFGRDIAVLLLASAGDLPPIEIVRDRPVSVGDTVTAIGYGVRVAGYDPGSVPPGAAGVKMQTTAPVLEVVTTELAIDGPTTCYGDSGGPALTSDRRVAGVVSRGEGYCTGVAIYTRVDAFLDLIDAAIRDTGGATAPPPDPPPPPPPPPEEPDAGAGTPPPSEPDAGAAPPPAIGDDAGRSAGGDGGTRRPLAREGLTGGGLWSGCSVSGPTGVGAGANRGAGGLGALVVLAGASALRLRTRRARSRAR